MGDSVDVFVGDEVRVILLRVELSLLPRDDVLCASVVRPTAAVLRGKNAEVVVVRSDVAFAAPFGSRNGDSLSGHFSLLPMVRQEAGAFSASRRRV